MSVGVTKVLVRGNDDSDLDERKIIDLINPGGSAVTDSTTEVFSFTCVARSALERGHYVSGQNKGKTRDLTTPASPDVAGSATEIFLCAHAVPWDGPAYNYKIGTMNTGQNYDVGDVDRRFFF